MKFILLLSILLPAVSAFEYLVAVGKDETTGLVIEIVPRARLQY